MIRIGKKFLKPHLCPYCGRVVMLVRHPESELCRRCRNKAHRKTLAHKQQQKKYNNQHYRRRRKQAIVNHPYCALCGRDKCLTCHHTVNVRTGEYQGKHLTVLCMSCHRLWEQKVNKIRASEGAYGKNSGH